MASTAQAHINQDEHGVSWIDDSNVKVIEVVLDRLAYGWSPEEIHFQHAHLSLTQIHDLLRFATRSANAEDRWNEASTSPTRLIAQVAALVRHESQVARLQRAAEPDHRRAREVVRR